MRTCKFTECVELVGEACKPFTGTKQYVSTGAVDIDHIIDADTEFVDYDGRPSRANLEVKSGDVLFAKMQGTQKTLLIDTDLANNIYSTGFCAVRAKKDILTDRCLYHLLTSEMFLSQKDNNCSGATQKAITNTGLNKIIISLPQIEKQKSISDQLDILKSIISKRRQELSAFDELVKARFVEMFGDPYSNPKEWQRISFREAGERLSDGPFGSNLKSEHYADSGIRVIRLGNIGVGKFIDSDKSFVSEEHYLRLKKYTCKSGDIVIGTLGEPNLRACRIPPEVGVSINKADCVHYVPRRDILNNDFVCQYINCPEILLLAGGMIHGQTRSRVSSGQIAQMPIFVPPLCLQEEFSQFVAQIDKSKSVVQKSLEVAQLLFDSLMQKYFG